MEVRVHNACTSKNCLRADPDLALAAETRPVNEGVTPDRDYRVRRVGPRRHRRTHPHVVAENHPSGSADDEPAIDPEVTASSEPNASNPAQGFEPDALEDSSPFSSRDAGL